MSDNKKVIHVKDLVIKADNVHIEPSRPQFRRDPFFGFGRERVEEEMIESSSISDESQQESGENRDNRRPFSWI